MEKYEIQVQGAPVVYSSENYPNPNLPNNPLNRPKISYRKPIIAIVLYLITTIAVAVATALLIPQWAVLICVGWSLLYFACIAKKTIIWLVHLYQNKAPDEVRLKCVFEPSCSEYMILAVKKYGVIIGVIKGVIRLLRCHTPNGGQDYP